MDRNQILKEILNDKELCKKWKIDNVDDLSITPTSPYYNKFVEVLALIIKENDNNLSDSIIYKKIKNLHNIG